MATNPRASSRDGLLATALPSASADCGQVVLWLPDVNDPGYRERLAGECRRLAQLTPEEDRIAADFARLAERTEGWR